MNDPAESPPSSELVDQEDLVDQEVEAVRQRLAELREQGRIPSFPPGEVESQFRGVVESVEAGLLAEAPIDVAPMRTAVGMPAGPSEGGIRSRLRATPGRTYRALKRRLNIGDVNAIRFATTAEPIIEELADRQRRLQDLVLEVQLDRIRELEYRVASLERKDTDVTAAGDPGHTSPDA